jgi:mono/diheme cytochrome c family protein
MFLFGDNCMSLSDFRAILVMLCSALVCRAVPAPLPAAAAKHVDFVRDIQPIFTGRCVQCHGSNRQEAQFRLDSKETALKGGELGVAIVPGKSADSLLIQAVAGIKPDLLMPKKGGRLTAEQIGLLRAWIDQGATWPEEASAKTKDPRSHWAFIPPVRPAAPKVKHNSWTRNPIDNFIIARLEKENLKLSPEADRRTLIRRLTLDLTGLPPTIKEVEDFVADRQPKAYELLVDRLLASPHYGERWGRHWLDLARYADTNGYEKDKPRSIWPYRDWVINALNRDLPFDQFAIEQLAGDLLPDATLDQKVATGFLRNSMLNQEGGIEPEQFRVEALIDRIDTLGKAFLGLTVNCCQCHNHKYDPFSQKEYYQLYAFLNNDDEAFVEIPSAKEKKQRDDILAKVTALEKKAMKENTNLVERMAKWEETLQPPTTNWDVIEPKDWHNFATKFEKLDDNSLLGGGDLQPGGVMHVWAETQLTNITGFRLEALTNPNLMYGGPGLLGKGTFLVREFVVEAYPLTNSTVTNVIIFRRAVADLEAPGFNITNAIDGQTNKGGWTPAPIPFRKNENHVAMFESAEPFGFPGGTRLHFALHQKIEKEKDSKVDKDSQLEAHMLGCFRLSATTNTAPLVADTLSGEQRKVLETPRNQRSAEQQLKLFEIFRLSDAASTNLNAEISNLFTNWPYPPTTLVLQQRPHPRITQIFKRGDRLRPTDEVEADVPTVLNPFPSDAPRNRLGLAKWIVAASSPTTARVFVNRVWQTYFGQGLVATPEDFGTRVEMPSHPELLDWLAVEFMQPVYRGEPLDLSSETSLRPWGIKHLHRLIVTSATYRQSSVVSGNLYAKDQYNRLLARAPRLRVEGEVVEDIALSVSGLLNPKIGGPGIYPPIPASVGDTVYGGFTWPETKGADRCRRAMYTFAKRSLPFPSLAAFDAPSGETSCPRRVRSNTPLQALTTLNEKTFVESAQMLALRVMKEGGPTDQTRVSFAFELCTGRKPSAAESEKLLKFWREQYDYFENRTAAAVNVSVPDLTSMPADLNLHKAAAWAMVGRAILNLDETITRE